ncbi:MAG: hypothetical protein HYX82_05950 [Chloroflexi bacterium]|nr:hypothetical protein [Chloroflexota bacterium]
MARYRGDFGSAAQPAGVEESVHCRHVVSFDYVEDGVLGEGPVHSEQLHPCRLGVIQCLGPARISWAQLGRMRLRNVKQHVASFQSFPIAP